MRALQPFNVLDWPIRRPVATIACSVVLVVLAIGLAMRLRPSGSLESMMAAEHPAVVALGRVLNDFDSTDQLLLIARLPREAANDSAPLRDFAQRLDRAIADDAALRAIVRDVRYHSSPSEEERGFFEQHAVPSALYYMNSEQFAKFKERLTLDSMRQQMARNEELIASPGPAADAIGKMLLKDALRLSELISETLLQGHPARTLARDELMLSMDGRSLLIQIRGACNASNLDFTKRFLTKIEVVAGRVNEGGLVLEYSGAYAIAAASERAIRSDMIRSVIGSVLLMQLLFLVMHRGPLTFLLAFVPTAVAIVMAFGVFAVVRREMSPPTAVVGAIIAGLGIDYTVHYLSHYSQLRLGGRAVTDGARCARRVLLLPVAAAAGTTIIALLAIAQSTVQALRDFALIAALGLAGAFIAAFTILPAFLMLLDQPASGCHVNRFAARFSLSSFMQRLQQYRIASLVLGVLLWIAACLFAVSGHCGLIPIEPDLTSMHPQPNRALELQHQIGSEFTVPANSLLVYIEAPSEEGLIHAAHQVARASVSSELRAAGVTGVYGLSSLLPDPRLITPRQRQIAQIELDNVLSDFHKAVDESIFSVAAFEEFENFLKRLVDTNKDPPRLQTLKEFEQLASTVLPREGMHAAENFQAVTYLLLDRPLADRGARQTAFEAIRAGLANLPHGAIATLTGLSVITHDMERSIRSDLLELLTYAAIAVIALLFLMYRSIVDVLLTLVPTLFGVMIVIAAMHAFDFGLNMINLVGAPMLVGIGVDGGIFVVGIARQQRAGAGDALAPALAASVHALVLTSLTTILAFGSLMLTSTPAIQSLGFLTAVGVAACLAGTLLVLMPLVLMRHSVRSVE